MLNLAQRNLKIFFRQKSAVFFSLLGVFVIIGLYVVFLGDVWAENFKDLPEINALMNNWIMAGIISVTAITTTMGAFGIMVEDKVQKNSKDFYASPIKRSKIVGGYVLSAYLIGLLMSILAFILGEAYIVFSGGELLPVLAMLKVIGIILLSVMMSSSLVFFIVSFFSSTSAFTTASTIIGTLVGFLTGIYLPIGSLPDGVQWAIKLFPVSHAGALVRQVMMENPMATSFAGIPDSYITDFQSMMGVTYTYGTFTATTTTHILVLVGTTILFLGLALFNVSRKH
ncbi:ABC transporter permease [Acetobacterium bakii]|uniref:ABC transporter n=1 Tax=Acetobacterium bakii TaxID=52689 RepID=A0A0L6U4H6_9FIRM|nr:ABC transporter permease [Acetobacterium bakii]KNZ43247.1 ABC transporter [Acetobacterium bakii]